MNKELAFAKSENFKKFTHTECEYFPCHKVNATENFNCLFCYCPLYALGDRCGGNYVYSYGVKDCSQCLIPHSKGGYDYITKKYKELEELASQNMGSSRKSSQGNVSSLCKAYIKIL